MPSVYLAGPIQGLSYDTSTSWRIYAETELLKAGIMSLSPLRNKEYLQHEGVLRDSYPQYALSSTKGITTRDRFDVMRCDVVLMNLLHAEQVSIGTMIELGWADAYRKPVVLVAERDNVHAHGMVEEVAGFIVDNLESGLTLIKALLVPASQVIHA